MRSKGFDGMVCSAASVMGSLGDRWGLIIMRDLLLGLARYDDLRKSTGATNITLTDRLRALEANGLVGRRQYQSRPDRYEYVPTARGRDLRLVMQALIQVGDKWRASDGLDRPVLHIDRQTGHRVSLAIVDDETGERIAPGDIDLEPGPAADALAHWRLKAGQENRRKSKEVT